MKITYPLALLGFLSLAACGAAGGEGDECTSDADCADGLECHMHDGEEDHGECEAHEDEDSGM